MLDYATQKQILDPKLKKQNFIWCISFQYIPHQEPLDDINKFKTVLYDKYVFFLLYKHKVGLKLLALCR